MKAPESIDTPEKTTRRPVLVPKPSQINIPYGETVRIGKTVRMKT